MKHTYLILFILFSFNGYSQEYFLNGTATFLGNDCYRLTTEATTQNGTVWYGDQINLNEPFDIQFRMNFGILDGNGADGICFVLQTVGTSAIGASGGGLGYLNFGTSLGIEFDTWQNGEYNDQGYDHIAILKNGDINHNSPNNIAGPVQADVFDQNIEDGEDHVVRITWDPSEQLISVYFDCVFRLSGQQDIINQIFGGENLVYWGFTAATGGSYNNQTVCLQENILSVGDEVTICSGMSTTLSAGSSLDGVYTWSPQDFLSDPNSATPVANPNASITYTVTFTDLCNNPVEATIDVNVVELEVSHLGGEIINCTNELSENSATINFDAAVFYEWEYDGEVVSSGIDNTTFVTAQSGEYIINASIDDVCFASTSFEIISDFSEYPANASVEGVINCYSNHTTLTANNAASNAIFQWIFEDLVVENSNAPEIEVWEPGEYTLIVTHPISGCSTEDVISVFAQLQSASVFLPLQDTLSCIKSSIEIQGIVIETFGDYVTTWSTEEGNIISGANTLTPILNAAGTYYLYVLDTESGCDITVPVSVFEADLFNIDLSSLTFPNIFSPNDDSKNEYWEPFLADFPEVKLSEIMETFDLKIYNRWGNLLFESGNAGMLWTGEDHEKGVYFYHVDYKSNCGSGISAKKEGTIHLVD